MLQNTICLLLPYFTTLPFPILHDGHASDKLLLSSGDAKGYPLLLCDLNVVI